MLLKVGIAAACMWSSVHAADMDGARAIEAKVLEARKKITTGDLRLRYGSSDATPAERISVRAVFDDSTDERRLRLDWVEPFPHVTGEIVSNGGSRVTRRATNGNRYFFYDANEYRFGPRRPAKAVSRHDEPDPMLFDPRLIGMNNVAFIGLHDVDLDLYLLRKDRKNVSVRDGGRIDGVATLLIEYHCTEGYDVALWIAPERDYSLVRVRTIRPMIEDRGAAVCTANMELRHDDEANVWFPSRVTITTRLGERTFPAEVLEVESASFNRPVDPRLFTLGGMNLQAGTRVAVDNGEIKVWDGTKLTP